jgi:porin
MTATPSLANSSIDEASSTAPAIGATDQVRPPAQKGVAPEVEHLLPDWGGLRANLADKGIYLLLDATTEFAGNITGGAKQGSSAANQIGFELDVDWQRLAGITGFSTHAIFVNRSGGSTSALFGDNLLPVQEIYGSGGNVAIHLVSIYGEESLVGGNLNIAAGRMNVENDFASSALYCAFMNNGLCGDPKALPGGDIGHSAFPDAVWAARVRVRPTPQFVLTTGVYEVNQALYSNLYRTGFEWGTSHDSGVYIPVELAYETSLGESRLPGHYKVGAGYDTSGTYTDFSSALLPPGTAAPKHSGNTQVWLLADQMLLRQGPSDTDGLIALAAFIHNDPRNSVYSDQYIVGLIDRGFWKARPKDSIGLLFTYAGISNALTSTQALETEFGLPFSNGATGQQTHEMVIEASYNIRVVRGLTFMPDFQYVIRPNGQRSLPDAAVLGFKAHVSF